MKNSPLPLVNPTTGNTITPALSSSFERLFAKSSISFVSCLYWLRRYSWVELGWPLSADKRAREKTNFLQEAQRKREEAREETKKGEEKEASSTLVHLAWSPVHRLQSSVEISSRPWSTKLLLLSKSLELAPLTSSGLLARSLAGSCYRAWTRGECARVRAQGRGKKSVVKPRLQIYDIELEVEGGPLEAGANKIWWPGGTS